MRKFLLFFRDFYRLVASGALDGCRHKWIEDGFGHRSCGRCQSRQILYENRYPLAGESRFEWR